MTPSATSIPTQTTAARAHAFMYVLARSWLTQKQIEEAREFGFAAARNADVGGGVVVEGTDLPLPAADVSATEVKS